MFLDDLHAGTAQKVQHQLSDLGLPTFHDVKDEFEKLYDKLDV